MHFPEERDCFRQLKLLEKADPAILEGVSPVEIAQFIVDILKNHPLAVTAAGGAAAILSAALSGVRKGRRVNSRRRGGFEGFGRRRSRNDFAPNKPKNS